MGHLKTHNIWFEAASLKLSKAKLPWRETKALLFPHLPSAFHLHRARGRAHHSDGTANVSSAQQDDLGESKGSCVGTSSQFSALLRLPLAIPTQPPHAGVVFTEPSQISQLAEQWTLGAGKCALHFQF